MEQQREYYLVRKPQKLFAVLRFRGKEGVADGVEEDERMADGGECDTPDATLVGMEADLMACGLLLSSRRFRGTETGDTFGGGRLTGHRIVSAKVPDSNLRAAVKVLEAWPSTRRGLGCVA